MGVPVPEVPLLLAHLLGQEDQEVEFSFHAQEIHIQAAIELVSQVAVDVEAGHQQVIDPLQQLVREKHGGLGIGPDQTLDD